MARIDSCARSQIHNRSRDLAILQKRGSQKLVSLEVRSNFRGLSQQIDCFGDLSSFGGSSAFLVQLKSTIR